MTSRSKIVGITRQAPDHDELSSETVPATILSDEDHDGETIDHDDMGELYDDIYGETGTEDINIGRGFRGWVSSLSQILLIGIFLGWSGFFAWTYYGEVVAGPTNDRIIALIEAWSLPAAVIGIAWLLLMRNSRAETDRFADAARLLRTESEALELRMRTVNEEIATAREFLAQNSRELENIGRRSSERLTTAAGQLGEALFDSDLKAKNLEEASSAAANNLEQLRKHLPVVTSAAKDVTNQIGNAGNSAQVQIRSLIAALQKVAESGDVAHEKVDAMVKQAESAATNIANSVNQSTHHLSESLTMAQSQSSDIARQLGEEARNTSQIIQESARDVEQMVAKNSEELGEQVKALRAAIEILQSTSTSEDERIQAMVSRLSTHIDESAAKFGEIEEMATERTSRLAFALETVADASRKLDDGLADNERHTDKLLEQSIQILEKLDDTGERLASNIPTALDNIQSLSSNSLKQLDAVYAQATAIDEHSDAMLARITTIQHLVATQKQAFAELMTSSNTEFALRQEQADNLNQHLQQTQTTLSEMKDAVNEDILAAVQNVSKATLKAAEDSRNIVDEEMSLIAGRLTEQNERVLASAVDEQIISLNKIVQDAVERSMTLSQESTQKISAQLAEIDEMTGNLEKRLEDAHAGFKSIDDDSFARQMLLLTESLNSTAIDVAKILSNEVTDTAWAAYLKGDRGVFTRRAVRLLDAGEARIIADHYGEESEFRDHVNRYIHDFEAMMRVLLSTRDGNAIGVTLLSSDIGKLYVALAQAIERLRN